MRVAGDTVGRYTIVALIGRGGMGEVYEAEDKVLKRRVALKLLPPGGDAEARERMLREARSAAAFEHGNAVMVFDAGVVNEGEPGEQTYLAMELVRGRTLRACVGDASITIGQRVRWLVDAARALAAAHRAGLVHRDVKPDNLMIKSDGRLKVLDFGIAKKALAPIDPSAPTEAPTRSDALTGKGSFIGTPQYAAPEQLRGEDVDGRSDQYAWGVTAYELLSGEPPFESESGVALVAKILTSEPRRLRDRNADVPLAVQAVVDRAMSKDAVKRFPSLDAAAEALEPFAARASDTDGGSPAATITRPPPNVAVRTARGAARVFFWIAAALGTFIIGVIAIGAMLGKLQYEGRIGGNASASGSASAPAPGVQISGFRCTDAVVSGGASADQARELARPIGYGACARLALETGLPWAHEKALGVGIDLATLSEAKVEVTLGDPAVVTVRVGDLEGQGKGQSPIEAVQRAVAALAPKIAPRPLSDSERAAWGATSDESARRIERMWRKLVIGDLGDPETAMRELIASDGDSPWPHAMKCLVTPTGSLQGRQACAGAVERLDKVSATRAKALRALALLMGQPETNDEAIKLFRQSYREAPADPDVAGLYGAVAVDSANEGFGIIDGVAQRFPTYAIVALNNAVTGPEVRDGARNKKYIARLDEILPEKACSGSQVDELLLDGAIDDARARVEQCVALFGASDGAFPATLLRVDVELSALELDRARELALPLLGDPREWTRIEANSALLASYMLAGQLAEAEKVLEAETARQRDQDSPSMAFQRATTLLRLHVLAGRAPPSKLVGVIADLERDTPTLPPWFKLRADALLAMAPGASKDLAEPAAQAVIASKNPPDVFYAIPLLRKTRGDKETLALLRSKRAIPTRTLVVNALDHARLLEATHAPASEVEAQYRLALLPVGLDVVGFEKLIARARLARLLDEQGKKDEATRLRAELERVLAHADPGVRELVDKR